MRQTVIVAGAALLVGGAIVWSFKPEPAPSYREVEVPVGAMLRLEPTFELSWLKRPLLTFMRQSLELQQRAIARGGAVREVGEFCAPVVEHVLSDSGPRALPSERMEVPADQLRSMLLSYRISDPWNPLARRKIEHFGATNAGDRFHDTFYGGGELAGGVGPGGSSQAQGSRWWWIQELVTHGLAFEGGRISCGAIP